MTKINQVIAAHDEGVVAIDTQQIDFFGRAHTIRTAARRLGFEKRDKAAKTKLYSSRSDKDWWFKRKEFLSWMYRWKAIPERRGKTRNQWATFCKQQSPSS